MKSEIYIECGKIVNTHGCRGGIKAESWCNSEADLASLKRVFFKKGNAYCEYKVQKASVFKQFVIFELYGINDMDSAMQLKDEILYAAREDFKLAEGEFFIADIIGLDVIDADNGRKYGTVKEIINRGASDIYIVNTPNGEKMIPAVEQFIISSDPNTGVFIRPIEGLLD